MGKVKFQLNNRGSKIYNAKLIYIIIAFLVLLTGLLFFGEVSGYPTTDVKLEAFAGPGQVNLTWETSLAQVDSYEIHRGEGQDFILDPSTLVVTVTGEVYNYTDYLTVTDTVYYYQARAVVSGVYYDSNRISIVPLSASPHGNYLLSSFSCNRCHDTHKAPGAALVGNSINLVCFRCHGDAGGSIYNVEEEYARSGSTHHDLSNSCASCHDAHDGGKDTEGNPFHLPGLLEITVTGEVYHQGGGDDFCFTCHDNIQSDYSPAESGHNLASLSSLETSITCLGCHEEHGADLVKLLKTNPNGGIQPATGNDDTFCLTCHNTPGFFDPVGSNFRNGTINLHQLHLNELGASGNATCNECHRPHGTRAGENSTAAHLVGFPATTVTAQTYTEPQFIEETDGGSCDLNCHGGSHDTISSVYQR
ncbi:MAG: cytochrome c3 family protein [Bacillota bacterium]